MIQAGLVGTGPIWQRYQSVLPRLRRTLHVAAVFDCTPALASLDSAESTYGLQSLARRADIQAVLLMNTGWTGLTALELAVTGNKPVLFADWTDIDGPRIERLHNEASEQGVTIMPAMWRRYMPASIRLQELIATDLGPPQSIELSVERPGMAANCQSLEPLIGWIDYCRNLFRSFPESTALTASQLHPDCPALQIHYPALPGADESGEPRVATIHMHPEAGDSEVPRITVACAAGSAVISSRQELAWNLYGEPPRTERLTSERSEEEIMLDLFCRRVVGGLIPVADCNDLLQAMRIVHDVGLVESFDSRI